MEIANSNIPLSYQTIKVTQSRIDKGLLSIPTSLIDLFPKERGSIYIADEDGSLKRKSFSPYSSSTRECRIGGLREFYNKFSSRGGDELVIQKLDDGVFKLLPENLFSKQISDLIIDIEENESDEGVQNALSQTVKLANISQEKFLENEFVKLSREPNIPERGIKINGSNSKREGVSYFLRSILRVVYNGKCQLTNFSFLMQNGDYYFEIHHINPEKGNHIKNLLVVSPNVHKQFTYANVEHFFDRDDWLRTVKFNGDIYNVFQKIDFLEKIFIKEIHDV